MGLSMLKTYRFFGGKRYQFGGDFKYLSLARIEAQQYRNKGQLARVTLRKSTQTYEVWYR